METPPQSWGRTGTLNVRSEVKVLAANRGEDNPHIAEEREGFAQDGHTGLEFDMASTGSDNIVTPPSLQDQLAHLDLSIHILPSLPRSALSSMAASRRSSLAVQGHSLLQEPTQPSLNFHFEEDFENTQGPTDHTDTHAPLPTAMDEYGVNLIVDSQPPIPSLPSQSVAHAAEEQPYRPHPDSYQDMCCFLDLWRNSYVNGQVGEPISYEASNVINWERPSVVSSAGDTDIQGIDWPRLGTTRKDARKLRKQYHLYATANNTALRSAVDLPDTERYFQFRQNNMAHRAWIEHFQLRNLIVTTSYNDVYFVSKSKILHTSPTSHRVSCAMDLTDSATSSIQFGGFLVTALASAENLIVAGGHRGEYAMQDLNSDYGTRPTKGYVSSNVSAITNHIHSFTSRTNRAPQAVFCSNDKHVRVLDCGSNTFVSKVQYTDTVNCAATSPNGRLRLLVGDFEGAIIADADSGRPLEHLSGHKDDAFACTWADDDIHVATAAQDRRILIWDARNWSQPLADIGCDMAYATSLRFSPVGGGKRLLVAAEAADVVNIIDADRFDRKQVLDFFGVIAGTAFSTDGSQLVVANSDRKFGGLTYYQRTGFGDFGEFDGAGGSSKGGFEGARCGTRREAFQWLPEYELDFDPRVKLSAKQRSRRGLGLDDISI